MGKTIQVTMIVHAVLKGSNCETITHDCEQLKYHLLKGIDALQEEGESCTVEYTVSEVE